MAVWAQVGHIAPLSLGFCTCAIKQQYLRHSSLPYRVLTNGVAHSRCSVNKCIWSH